MVGYRTRFDYPNAGLLWRLDFTPVSGRKGRVASIRMFFPDNPHPSGMSFRQLAIKLIAGDERIFSRPLFWQFTHERREVFEQLLSKHLQLSVLREDMRESMITGVLRNRIGSICDDLREIFVEWVWAGSVRPPNGDRYLKWKKQEVGRDMPFVLYGDLMNSLEVSYELGVV